ncbi:MAG TPA: hypothetical protein VGU61_09450, partial [Noviherbaspirillum sp.]|nr:hypothetical protein [Noviherbaspirillum sp.]
MDTIQKNSEPAGQQTEPGQDTTWAMFESTLQNVVANYGPLEEQLLATGRETVEAVDLYVKENPWQAVGIGA